jgi:hypothetical protein
MINLLSNFFTFERDPILQTKYLNRIFRYCFFFSNRYIIAALFSPSIETTAGLFIVSHDAKFIFSDHFFHLLLHFIVIQMRVRL